MPLLQTLHTVQLEAVSPDVVHHDALTLLLLVVGITLLVQENHAGDDQTKQEPDDLTAPATIAGVSIGSILVGVRFLELLAVTFGRLRSPVKMKMK